MAAVAVVENEIYRVRVIHGMNAIRNHIYADAYADREPNDFPLGKGGEPGVPPKRVKIDRSRYTGGNPNVQMLARKGVPVANMDSQGGDKSRGRNE